MKKFVIVYLLSFLFFGLCQNIMGQDNQKIVEISSTDSIEYEIIIFDTKFDTYLALIAKPKEFYSEHYYKSWNIRYVQVWNERHLDPIKYGDFYETYIHYNYLTDYGLDLNYKLYNYFKFIEKEYKINLIRR
jgi:hypothetical protein